MTPYSFLLGWHLVRPTAHEWLQPDLPGAILSGSHCLCDVRPHGEDMYEEDIDAFLVEHAVNLGFQLHFFPNVERAQRMKARWLEEAYLPLAVALQPQSAQRLDAHLRDLETQSNRTNPNFSYTALEPQKFSGRERLRGYDVLGYLYGYHSFLCNGLQKELVEIFKGTLTPQGLIADAAIAEKFAQYINDEEAGEPGLYLAYAVFAPE